MIWSGNTLSNGSPAPDFELPAQNGGAVRLHDLLAKGPVVLYFYPKDNTPGCTAEACAFRDNFEVFSEAGAQVVGVSSDSVGSHAAFAQQYRLPFTLLSDQSGQVRRLYKVSTFGLFPGRTTYVIDRRGTVRHVFSDLFNGPKHVEEALTIVRRLVVEEPPA